MTKRIEELLTQIQATPGCRIKAPARQPQIEANLRLPDDLQEFYQLCGGLTLAEKLVLVTSRFCFFCGCL